MWYITVLFCISLEEGMATHCSILTWRIPWTENLVGFSSWGLKELNTTEATDEYSNNIEQIFMWVSAFHISLAKCLFKPYPKLFYHYWVENSSHILDLWIFSSCLWGLSFHSFISQCHWKNKLFLVI